MKNLNNLKINTNNLRINMNKIKVNLSKLKVNRSFIVSAVGIIIFIPVILHINNSVAHNKLTEINKKNHLAVNLLPQPPKKVNLIKDTSNESSYKEFLISKINNDSSLSNKQKQEYINELRTHENENHGQDTMATSSNINDMALSIKNIKVKDQLTQAKEDLYNDQIKLYKINQMLKKNHYIDTNEKTPTNLNTISLSAIYKVGKSVKATLMVGNRFITVQAQHEYPNYGFKTTTISQQKVNLVSLIRNAQRTLVL